MVGLGFPPGDAAFEAGADLYRRDGVIAGVQKLRFFPLAVRSGAGSWLIEDGGRRLLDLSASWTASALGHGHPAVADAVTRAMADAPGASVLSAAHPEASALAHELLQLVPGGDDRRVYLGHAGSDANDVALRSARTATGRRKIVSFERSYHGGLGVAMAASGVHVASGAVMPSPDIVFVPYPDPFLARAGDEDPVAASVDAVSRVAADGDVACVIVEPILSDGGLVVPPDGFLAALASVCQQHGIVLICDEVKVGLGRTGLMHAFLHDGITPDIVTMGKALGGGLPLSAAIGPSWALDRPTASALLTTAGNPVCAAAGRAVLRAIDDLGLVERAAVAGDRMRRGLAEATAGLDCVADIRGRGLVTGVQLVAESPGDGASLRARRAAYRLWELGAVAYCVGDGVLEITPPLVITDSEIDVAVGLLAAAIADAAAGRVDDAVLAQFTGW